MPTTWILVANSAQAHILERRSRREPLRIVSEFRNEDARAHEGDLVTDGGAAVMQRMGKGQQRHTEPEVSTREHRNELFAADLADTLQKGRAAGDYEELVLVAAPAFLGKLRDKIDNTTMRCVTSEIDKNLSHLAPSELLAAVEDLLDTGK